MTVITTTVQLQKEGEKKERNEGVEQPWAGFHFTVASHHIHVHRLRIADNITCSMNELYVCTVHTYMLTQKCKTKKSSCTHHIMVDRQIKIIQRLD